MQKKRSKKARTKKRRAGTIWSTIRYGTKDIKDCYDGSNENASVNIGPALSRLPNSVGVRKCEDYYMGTPGNSGAQYIIDNCNRLVYSNPESWQPGNKKLFFCRKGENKTGQCRTSSFKRNQLGECSSGSLFKAISSAAINDGKQFRTNQRLEAESIRAQLPSAVGMTKQQKEQDRQRKKNNRKVRNIQDAK